MQDLGGDGIEVICADDASRDDSAAFLQDLAAILGSARAEVEECEAPASAPKCKKARIDAPMTSEATDGALSTNPALTNMALRAAETADHPSFKGQEEPEDVRQLRENPVTAEQVAAACRPEHRLRVLKWKDGVNRGQGAAMTLCLSRVKSPYIAQMESDDEREDQGALRKMLEHLQSTDGLDGVSCLLKTVGWERPGMQRYVEWQNSCKTEKEMSKGRFIEIPALHQTALFRTDTVLEVTQGAYRDGPSGDDDLDVPVDMWWWLTFFHRGKRCCKVGEILFGWRQHPRQHTRTHGRLSIENLRKIKVHFLLRPGSPAHGRHVEVWSVGKSLEEWATALQAHPNAPTSLTTVNWKPGMPLPVHWKCPPRQKNQKKVKQRSDLGEKTRETEEGGLEDETVGACQAAEAGNAHARGAGEPDKGDDVGAPGAESSCAAATDSTWEQKAREERGSGERKEGKSGQVSERPVRLFVFGMAKARRSVSLQIRDWNDELDWFVA